MVDTRKSDIARIHMLRKQLNICADDASALQIALTGKPSSADMSAPERLKVINHLQGLADRLAPASKSAKPATPRKKRLSGPLALMWSLWQQSADAKVIQDRRFSALEAFAKGHTGVAKLEWLSKPQQDMVIAILRQMAKRGQPS